MKIPGKVNLRSNYFYTDDENWHSQFFKIVSEIYNRDAEEVYDMKMNSIKIHGRDAIHVLFIYKKKSSNISNSEEKNFE